MRAIITLLVICSLIAMLFLRYEISDRYWLLTTGVLAWYGIQEGKKSTATITQ